jgi:hypothetical protein
MPWFITIGYGDEAGYVATDEAVRLRAHAHDSELADRGAVIGAAGSPVQVRNHDEAGVRTSEGAFLTASLPVAGFALIEAADMASAVELVSGAPCAVAQGVVEVWPLLQGPS